MKIYNNPPHFLGGSFSRIGSYTSDEENEDDIDDIEATLPLTTSTRDTFTASNARQPIPQQHVTKPENTLREIVIHSETPSSSKSTKPPASPKLSASNQKEESKAIQTPQVVAPSASASVITPNRLYPSETHPFIRAALSEDTKEMQRILDQQTFGLTRSMVVIDKDETFDKRMFQNPNMKGLGGKTALMVAAEYNKQKAVDFLMTQPLTILNGEDDKGNTPVMYAARNGNAEILQKLLEVITEKKGHLNRTNDNGETALMQATAYGKSDCVYILLKNGAALDIKDKHGRTARQLAVTASCIRFLEAFKKRKLSKEYLF